MSQDESRSVPHWHQAGRPIVNRMAIVARLRTPVLQRARLLQPALPRPLGGVLLLWGSLFAEVGLSFIAVLAPRFPAITIFAKIRRE